MAEVMDAEFYAKTFSCAKAHADDCEWHHDQYWHECTCGLIRVDELLAEIVARKSPKLDGING